MPYSPACARRLASPDWTGVPPDARFDRHKRSGFIPGPFCRSGGADGPIHLESPAPTPPIGSDALNALHRPYRHAPSEPPEKSDDARPTGSVEEIELVRAMLENAERIAQLGSWELRLDEDVLVWSENLFRIYGYEPGEIEPSVDHVLSATHPDDRGRVIREARLMMTTDRPRPPIEYRIVRPDGGVRYLRASTALVESTPGSRRIVGAVEDRSDSHQSEREIAAHSVVSRALTDWESLDLGGMRLLRTLGGTMGFDRGILWLPAGDVLEPRLSWYSHAPAEAELHAELERTRLPRGVGLAGRAWESRGPVTIGNVAADSSYTFRKEAEREGLRGAIAFPAPFGDEVIAVLGFASREDIHLTERLTDCLVAIGAEVGRFLSRRRGELRPALLSRRELQVLQVAADGAQGPAIAEQLGISASTVRTHFEHIYEKLGVTDRGSAVAAALREGLID